MHTHLGHHAHGQDGSHRPGDEFRGAKRYDAVLAMALAGRGRRYRARLADLLELRPGHDVLDLGCGTGTLALGLARVIARSGGVTGVDASPSMIERARAKAARRRLPVTFRVGVAQALPFADNSFDAAASSLVLHHLPEADRPLAVQELVRVVRPGGRVVLADIQPATKALTRRLTRHLPGPAMHRGDLRAVEGMLTAVGVQDVRLEPTPVGWIGVVHGRVPD